MLELLCTDLDRTLLPNGEQPESAAARRMFAQLVVGSQCKLAYVTGRDIALVQHAIAEYQLPLPDYAITDVGSMIYVREGEQYQLLPHWHDYLAQQWPQDSQQLARQLGQFAQLQPQPEPRQKRFKLCYQLIPAKLLPNEVAEVKRRLANIAWPVHLITSVDETADQGLVDLLPPNASKRGAIDFLVTELGLQHDKVFFSGDSGNDLDVLVSPYPAVIVKNALAEVVMQAVNRSKMQGLDEQLWVAQGDESLGLNGNYSGGIVEGLLYFYPQLKRWLTVE
ncbi:HAD-IIB family hydrolase [Shewanella avicenniae]|uniref:HAD-IIB family hydrolase n=1 Tax=Shewanella avicenniae TaxID=2814294 RepID=A0ABX7QNL5_9GAMM|nr:HAD-IIB family hydrolase [Shewanella avicenniae]QSX33059.1 HAD-IIB family hydrolase [Shewanella avicenniae]